jgi:hypothetical protein
MIRLEDLMEMEGMYYVGDIVDVDGSNWVDKKSALEILESINEEA